MNTKYFRSKIESTMNQSYVWLYGIQNSYMLRLESVDQYVQQQRIFALLRSKLDKPSIIGVKS